MCRLLPTALALLWSVLPAATAHAQPVQRCTGADGRAVYTDRRCDDIGAVSRLPQAGAGEAPRLFRGGCPRVLSQLVGEIGAAIQNRDVNRLASVYDWRDVSDASASRLLDRLEAMVERPLVDIAPVYAAGEPAPYVATTTAAMPDTPPPAGTTDDDAPSGGPAAWMPSWSAGQPADAATAATAATDGGGSEGDTAATTAPAMPAARPRPVGLRIEQTLAGSATPARTVFGLRRDYGCFWIRL